MKNETAAQTAARLEKSMGRTAAYALALSMANRPGRIVLRERVRYSTAAALLAA